MWHEVSISVCMNRLLLLLLLATSCIPAYAARHHKAATDILFIEHAGRNGDSTLLVYNVPKKTGKLLTHLNRMKTAHKGGYNTYQQKTNKILENYAHTWLKAMPAGYTGIAVDNTLT